MDSQFGSKSWGILGSLKYSRPLQSSHLLVRLFLWSSNRHLLQLPQLTLSGITTNLFPVSPFRYCDHGTNFLVITYVLSRRWVNLFPFLNLQDFVKRNNPLCSFKKTDQNFLSIWLKSARAANKLSLAYSKFLNIAVSSKLLVMRSFNFNAH